MNTLFKEGAWEISTSMDYDTCTYTMLYHACVVSDMLDSYRWLPTHANSPCDCCGEIPPDHIQTIFVLLL